MSRVSVVLVSSQEEVRSAVRSGLASRGRDVDRVALGEAAEVTDGCEGVAGIHGGQRVGPERDKAPAHRSEQATEESGETPLIADGGHPSSDQTERVADPLSRISDGVVAVDDEWEVTYLNDAAREVYSDAVEGISLLNAVPAIEDTMVQTKFEAAMENQQSQTFEEFLPDLDHWVEFRVYPDAEGLSVIFRLGSDPRTREQVETREGALQRLHELASTTDLEPMEKVSEILEVGRDHLEVDIGFLTNIENDTQEIIEAAGDHPEIQPGKVAPLDEAYCRRTIGREDPLAVDNAIGEGWEDDPAYERYGLACYLGATIRVGEEEFGTVCFADRETRETSFSEAEQTFIDLVTDWVSFVLTRREYDETLRARGRQLSGILERSRSLMQARSREEVSKLMAAAARDVLGYDYTVVRLYDADTGTLAPVGTTQAAEAQLGDRPVYEVGEGLPGEVFASGESRIVNDLSDVETRPAGIQSAMYYPVGVHGTISVGAPEQDAYDERDLQILGLLATSAAAANTRAKREREVREAREHVEMLLERVNGIVESVVKVLVNATTRDELEAGVVEELAGADPYAFAWMGRPDLASETLSPTAWAGEAGIPAAELSVPLNEEDPVTQAYRREELQVVDDVSADDDGVCGGATECEQVESAIAVPLTYKDTSYGVLAVFASEQGAFDQREQVILGALGEAIANGINAVERGRILDADEVIEVEFAVSDPDLLTNRLSREADRVESAGTDYRSDGRLTMYLTAEGGDSERLLDIAQGDERVLEATLLTEHEGETLLEATVEETLVATLGEYGAVTTSVVAETGTTRVTVELPYEAEARELYDLVEDRHPGTELVGYHEHERPMETRQDFRAALADRFTDRQESALRTAFLGGFFEWPRNIDGNELAEAMDISRPTYHQHLRAAQKKVLEALFDQDV